MWPLAAINEDECCRMCISQDTSDMHLKLGGSAVNLDTCMIK